MFGLVTLEQMRCALTTAVEIPVQATCVVAVPEIPACAGEMRLQVALIRASDHCSDQSNAQNYESACPWDIYSLTVADEMVVWRTMKIDGMDELQLRIARVTDDLRTIQQELNCAAMQAPSDPELMEALSALSETEPIETLKVALDQMRHFLWFYSQVVNNEQEFEAKLRQARPTKTSSDENPKRESSFLDQLSRADELMLLHHLTEAKRRKPN